MVARSTGLLALTMLAACGLEAPLFSTLLSQEHRAPIGEPPAPVPLTLSVPGMPGADVSVLSADGGTLASGTAGADGLAGVELAAGADYRLLRFVAVRGERLVAGLVPRVPPSPGAAPPHADDRTLAQLLVLEAAAARVELPLDVMDGESVAAALSALAPGTSEAVDALLAAVARLVLEADPEGEAAPSLDPSTLTVTHPELQAATEALAADLPLAACRDESVVRVVFQVEFNDGMIDANCGAIDRFKWTKDDGERGMFITGGVHEDTEGMSMEESSAASALIGDWEPNRVPLFDDGTQGDAEAGDGVWTLVVEMPVLEPPVKLEYKYTWGRPGAGWTGAEEWPGNSRLLELVDHGNDGRIVRYDHYGDETTNKDKQNMRRGSIGVVTWSTDADDNGFLDAREGPVDLDGDCVMDDWPSPGPVGPKPGACTELPTAEPVEPAERLRLADISPKTGPNGGGTVVSLTGEGFTHPLQVEFGGVPARAVYLRSSTEAVAVAPRQPEGRSDVALRRTAPAAYIPRDGLWTAQGPAADSVPACRLEGPETVPPDGGSVPSVLAERGRHQILAVVEGSEPGQDFGLTLELGVGAADTDPAKDPSWRFVPAAFLAAGEAPLDANDDLYSAELPFPSAGAWLYGFRASADGGRTWRYCQGLGQLTVEATR